MNDRNCFDFNYNPTEGDNIVFKYFNKKKRNANSESLENGYISFIYKDSNWKIDYYNPFYDQTQVINQGILKIK